MDLFRVPLEGERREVVFEIRGICFNKCQITGKMLTEWEGLELKGAYSITMMAHLGPLILRSDLLCS